MNLPALSLQVQHASFPACHHSNNWGSQEFPQALWQSKLELLDLLTLKTLPRLLWALILYLS